MGCADNPFIDSKEINLLIKDYKKYSEKIIFLIIETIKK